MRITLVGSRHFGVTILEMLRQHGVEIALRPFEREMAKEARTFLLSAV